jgi:hypothetical protein
MRLIEEYTNAATELSDALTKLHLRSAEAGYRSKQADNERFQGIVRECELKLEQARMAFEKHTAEHGC